MFANLARVGVKGATVAWRRHSIIHREKALTSEYSLSQSQNTWFNFDVGLFCTEMHNIVFCMC